MSTFHSKHHALDVQRLCLPPSASRLPFPGYQLQPEDCCNECRNANFDCKMWQLWTQDDAVSEYVVFFLFVLVDVPSGLEAGPRQVADACMSVRG